MKKYTILIIFLFLTSLSDIMAQSIAHYFVQMPANMIPTIKTETRKDLVDFYQNGKLASMLTSFGGEVILKELTDNYLLLQISDHADIQMKILPLTDSTRVLAVVQTVLAPLKHSTVKFYSTLWELLPQIAFPSLTYRDFLDMEKGKVLGLSDHFNDISLRNFIYCKFRSDEPQVVVYSSIREDIRPEIKKDFEPVIIDSLIYDWNKGNFKNIKP